MFKNNNIKKEMLERYLFISKSINLIGIITKKCNKINTLFTIHHVIKDKTNTKSKDNCLIEFISLLCINN